MIALSDLKANCGLDLKIDNQSCHLVFGRGITAPLPAVRDIRQMQEVLLDHALGEPEELYYMYRDVHLVEDEPLLEKNNLRYDVTCISFKRLGRELMKTAGHYHPGSFGELYEVVLGEALCMLQKPNPQDYTIIEDVIIAEAHAGQKIVIPPGYGHILVNPGPGCLVTSNWVSSCFASEYNLYKEAKGAAYFLTIDATGRVEYLKNAFFKNLAPIRFAEPAKILNKFGLKEGEPIYPIVKRDAEKLDFLNHPIDYDYSDVFVFKK
jgi:glucose-6-phosphate isomerase